MAVHSFSHSELASREPGYWLAECSLAFRNERDRIKALAVAGAALPPMYPIGWTLADINLHFNGRVEEADKLSTLKLLAAAEAALRIDFVNRVRKRVKTGASINTDFRAAMGKWPRITLEGDILGPWARHFPATAGHIGNFKNALQTRHWLAHGRWWTFKRGQLNNHAATELVVADLLNALGNTSASFFPTPL